MGCTCRGFSGSSPPLFKRLVMEIALRGKAGCSLCVMDPGYLMYLYLNFIRTEGDRAKARALAAYLSVISRRVDRWFKDAMKELENTVCDRLANPNTCE